MVIYPGDPLTPGVGATKDAKRLDRKDAPTILKIPVLPISYHDAQPLLAALDGRVAPGNWQGGLPITYHIGAGKAMVHLKMEFNWDMVPAYDVIAKIKGSKWPDEWVIRGNHHDAWVNGAGDPISGQSAMLNEAKALGDLLKSGWKPKRSIIYCSWDGEEPGLLGSTEFAEGHDKELQEKAVVYINSDGNGRGFLGTGGSQALEPFMDEITQNVTDPQTNVSVFDRRKAKQLIDAASWNRWVRVRTFRRFYSTLVSQLWILPLAAKMAAASTTQFMIRLTITAGLRTRLLNMELHLHKLPGMPCCAWPMQSCCPLISATCKPPLINMLLN